MASSDIALASSSPISAATTSRLICDVALAVGDELVAEHAASTLEDLDAGANGLVPFLRRPFGVGELLREADDLAVLGLDCLLQIDSFLLAVAELGGRSEAR